LIAILLKTLAVEYGDVILAANGDPDLLAIGREKRLVRRATDYGSVLTALVAYR